MKMFRSMAALLALVPPLLAQELPPLVPVDHAPLEHQIYIPYEEFWQVFEKEDRGVFLPYAEFRKLWDAARAAAEKVAPEAPEGVAIAEITGHARVIGDVVRVEMDLTLDAMSAAWHEVPLGLKEVTLSRATLGGQPARVRGDSAAGYTLLLHHRDDEPGRHLLKLEFAVALQTGTPGAAEGQGIRGFRFSLPPAPVSRWRLHVPEPGIELHIEPQRATATLPEEDPETETLVEIFLAAAPALDVRWTPRVEGAMDLDPMIQANLVHFVKVGSDITRNYITAQLNISRAPVPQVSFAIPAGERVVDVRTNGLRAWSVTELDDGQRLDVVFLEPVRGEQRIALDLERYQPPARRVVPMVEVLDTVSQRGSLVVSLDAELRADAAVVQGITRQDPTTVIRERAEQVPLSFGYQYRALPFELALDVEEVRPRITARNRIIAHLDPLALDLQVEAILDVRRSGVFQLALDVPASYVLSDLEAHPAQHRLDGHQLGDPEEGRRTLLVDFASRVTGEVTLKFRLRREMREEALLTPTGEEVFFDIPVVRAIGEQVHADEGTLLVFAPDYLTLRVAESSALRPISSVTVNGGHSVVGPHQFGFAYAADAPSLRIGALRRAPHVTVGLLQTVRVEAGVARFEALLHSQVLYSGVQGLRLDVPTELVNLIQIQNVDVRRRVLPDAADLDEGMTAWMLERPAEFIGDTEIRLTWETPMEGLDVGAQRPLDIPRLIPRAVDRAWGQIVLRKAEALDIAVGEHSPGLTPIDPRHDLMRGRTYPDAALAFEFHREWTLTAVVTRYEPAELKATSIERGLVRQVLTRGGQTTVQALYRMRSTRQRLEVRLPEGAEPDARPLWINGRPGALERGIEGHVYIPLTSLNADEPLLLELRYTLADGGNRLHLPHFVNEPAVQQVYLSVHIPDNVVYLGHLGPWNPEYVWRVEEGFRLLPKSRMPNRELLQWVSQGVAVDAATLDQLPVDGQHLLFSSLRPETRGRALAISTFPLRLFYGGVIGGGVLLGLLLLRVRLHTRLVVVATVLALLVLAAVFTPSLSRALINDATAGGAFLVVILWFVWDVVVRWPRYRHLHRAKRGPAASTPPSMPAKAEEVHDA